MLQLALFDCCIIPNSPVAKELFKVLGLVIIVFPPVCCQPLPFCDWLLFKEAGLGREG